MLAELSTRAWVSAYTYALVDGWFEAPHTGSISFLLPKDALGTLTWATDPWVTPTTLASVTTATTAATLSPWPTWPADTAGGAIAAKVSVVAGQRYWLQLNCPAPTTGAQGCAVGARFHTEEAPYPLTLTARKLSGRIKGSTSCAAITVHYYYLHFTLLGVELLTLPLILLLTQLGAWPSPTATHAARRSTTTTTRAFPRWSASRPSSALLSVSTPPPPPPWTTAAR